MLFFLQSKKSSPTMAKTPVLHRPNKKYHSLETLLKSRPHVIHHKTYLNISHYRPPTKTTETSSILIHLG